MSRQPTPAILDGLPALPATSTPANRDEVYDLAYDRMTALLTSVTQIDEAKNIRDKAEALRVYARQAGESLQNQNKVAAIKLRAERRIGELLQELERGTGGQPYHSTHSIVERVESEYRTALTDNNIAPTTANRFQSLAEIPEDIFEETITGVLESDEYAELTSNMMYRKAQEIKRQQKAGGMAAAPALPTGRYRVFYADPPWQYGNSGVITGDDNYGRAERHYPAMNITELCALGRQIRAMAEDDAVLFMWVTSPLLAECFPVISAWGFQYKTSFVWDKVRHNFGHYNSVRHELLLICTRGSCTPDTPTLHDSVIVIERSDRHSEKPEEFRRMIDSLYTWGARIELFARTRVDGWEAWGNE